MDTNLRSEAIAITVYDVENKKPVLVFCSLTVCEKYLLNGKEDRTGNRARYYLTHRTQLKPERNVFNKLLAIRSSTPAQKAMLGENERFVILDERFVKTGITNDLHYIKYLAHENRLNTGQSFKHTVNSNKNVKENPVKKENSTVKKIKDKGKGKTPRGD